MSTEYQVGELAYHDSRESLLSSMRPVDVDIVGRYRAVLGMSAGELAGETLDDFSYGFGGTD